MPEPLAYEDGEIRRNREYREECASFVEKMSAEEREKARSLGLLKEVRKNGRPTGKFVLSDTGEDQADDVCREDDAAVLFENSSRLSAPETATTLADKIADVLADTLSEKYQLTRAQAEGVAKWHLDRVKEEVALETASILRRVIGFFLLADNAKMGAHALAHAARLARLTGFSSLRRSAEAVGVSVEALRKVAWKWVALLNLPPLEGAKTPEARARYSETQTKDHWRNRKCTLENLKAPKAASNKS